MRSRLVLLSTTLIVGLGLAFSQAAPPQAGNAFQVDSAHSWVAYRVKHNGLANSFGMFKDVSGSFTFDEQAPEKSSIEVVVKVDSIDSANTKRDGHLKSQDFFNAKQFPTIKFKSKKVAKSGEGYEVTGDLTLHGVTKEIGFKLDKVPTKSGPRGGASSGFNVDLPIKRSEFGMSGFLPMIDDEVLIMVGIEGGRR
jgi:polyisoprenoid-binding protein YceI